MSSERLSLNQARDRVRQLLQAGELDEALRLSALILEQAPRDPTVTWLRGRAQAERGDRQAALATLSDAAELNPNDPAVFEQLAEVLVATGHPGEAVNCLRHAVALTRRSAQRSGIEASVRHRQLEALTQLSVAMQPLAPLPPMGGWAISADFAALLYRTVRQRRPRLILELGGGVSSVVTGYALRALGSGHVVSLDHDAAYAEQTRAEIALHGLDDLVTVRHAPLEPMALEAGTWQWYAPAAYEDLVGIDLVTVDGPPAALQALSRYPAYPALRERLGGDAALLLDDTARDAEQRIMADWMGADAGLSRQDFPCEKGAALLSRR